MTPRVLPAIELVPGRNGMRGAKLWLIGLAVLVSPGAQGGQCTMARVSELPVRFLHGHALVQASLNRYPATLIFDTGAFTSLLSDAAVDRLQLRRMQGEDVRNALGIVSGIGGRRSARFVTAHTVELGGLHGRDYNFVASDFGVGWADGLLSIDLISQFDVDLDVAEAKIVLYRPTGDCSAPAAFLAGPLYSAPLEPEGVDRRPRVKVSIGGRALVALLDTGAPRSAIFRSAAQQLGLRAQPAPASQDGWVSGVGPSRVAATQQMLSDVSVGDLDLARLPVQVLDGSLDDDVQMILGADFQAQVHVWVSYSSHTLIMQFPARGSKPVTAP